MADRDESKEALGDAIAELLQRLLATLDAFDWMGRRLHPGTAARLVETIGPLAAPLATSHDALRDLAWPDHLDNDLERLAGAAEIVGESILQIVDAGEPWRCRSPLRLRSRCACIRHPKAGSCGARVSTALSGR